MPADVKQLPTTKWLLSAAAVAAAVALRRLLDPILGNDLPLVTLFGAVAYATWLAGWPAALAATLLGYAACDFLFIKPRGTVDLDNPANIVGFIAYLLTCLIIIALGEALRAARRRSAENEVEARRQASTLSITLASIGDGVITTDAAGRVVFLNPVAEKLTGWTTALAVGRPLDEVFRIINDRDRQPVENPVARVLKTGQVVGLANHTLLIDRHGTERAIDDSAAPIRAEDGTITGVVLVFRDVTELTRAQRARAMLAAIVESSDDAIVSKTLDGVIQTWNAAAERIFGHSAEQAVGRHIELIIPPDRADEERRIIERLRAGQRVDHFDTWRLHSDRRLIPVSLTISPIRDESGKVIGASKIARDITARSLVEEERREIARRKDEFLAMLAHELRNPLAPITHALRLIENDVGPNAPATPALEVMKRQVAQVVRLVDDLLDANRITRGTIELRRQSVELAAVIQQAVETSLPLIEAAGHHLKLNIPPEPIQLNADPVRLAQVFSNLLNNAAKYTAPGGQIDLTVERQSDRAVIRLRDNGVGIAREKLGTIFEMFMQIDNSLERSQGGLGIGLSLVRHLVRLHDGSVEARSEGIGKGSEFIVRLPIAARQPGEQPAPIAPARADSPSRRILIVDDNRDSAAMLAALLKGDGAETRTAHDGHEAINAAEDFHPEIILLDIGLPGLNGYDVCRRLRTRPWAANALIIALTGWGQDEDRRKSSEAGFNGHLVKPVDFHELSKLISRPETPSADR